MISSKVQLLEYCLRELGSPIVEINVTEEQLSDRFDYMLKKYQQFGYDATQKTYLKHVVSADDITNGYIDLPESVMGVSRVLPYMSGGGIGGTQGDAGLFSAQYQFRLNDLWNLQSGTTVYYEMAMENLAMLDMLFNGQPIFRFNKTVDRVYIDTSWINKIMPGSWLMLECYVTIDPDEHNKIYNEVWVKDYMCALIKRQWATNIKKFSGVMTIGGALIDGQELYNEACDEVEKLEQDLRDIYEEPVQFFMG